MVDNYHIILASNSPRRRELLGGLDLDFEVKVLPDIEEDYPDNLETPEIPVYIVRPIQSWSWVMRCWGNLSTSMMLVECYEN